MHKYYVILAGSGEIEKYGPYATDEERDTAAKEIWAEANQEQQTIHWLNVDRGNTEDPAQIGDYSNGELEGDE